MNNDEYDVKSTVLTQRDYRDALLVGNAVNLSGIVFGFVDVMRRICDESNANHKGTAWKNSHPIAILYSAAIAGLTGCGASDTSAYTFCKKKASGERQSS